MGCYNFEGKDAIQSFLFTRMLFEFYREKTETIDDSYNKAHGMPIS